MSSPYAATRENIELRLTLNVILGDLDESFAHVWRDAFRSLEDRDIARLLMMARRLDAHQASALTLRVLMEHHYPFREMVMYQTDAAFKRRMGLDGSDQYH
jgi:hypothetical protein